MTGYVGISLAPQPAPSDALPPPTLLGAGSFQCASTCTHRDGIFATNLRDKMERQPCIYAEWRELGDALTSLRGGGSATAVAESQ